MEHSQPAHLVTIVAVVYLAFRLFPDSRRHATEASTLTRLLYIAAVSTVFGSQVWMTFIAGKQKLIHVTFILHSKSFINLKQLRRLTQSFIHFSLIINMKNELK